MGARITKFSYSGDPQASPRDGARFYLADTDERRPLMNDYEIDACTAKNPDPRMAAAVACEILSVRFSREADFTAGSVSKSFSQIAAAYALRAAELRAIAGRDALPFFGGQSRSAKGDLLRDSDAVKPRSHFNMGDDYQALQFEQLHTILDGTGWWGGL